MRTFKFVTLKNYIFKQVVMQILHHRLYRILLLRLFLYYVCLHCPSYNFWANLIKVDFITLCLEFLIFMFLCKKRKM
ncbi:hypothetical protein GLOIN_2v1628132 [Rhizophagus irregularis DAOM 181602=DAOM 197198]|uniref:Uncharacterized protein n=1 Tax=Rhizophagus irregularis (strain DAOM 181602 / DAOM 197198 / MUCL 43194) TaxID=747089 RepID=A0A2P4PV66_RHIID|nr:hypothetical protein GLOIN_2v1628132 [Rhizophagus irregularis DAOM 181602=DAOM 197198]POG69293.1 hypothetical protein GLOIN_2v1628132 [Rhizophagus irregularis DAOM 181602=DAOM 197198]GET55820.1 hypothetical protein GLOIN_2v1628132 [Rhizophagus irregularis DAOM 181602=DAOM 197198]|eukprot:XP_025176159.1 hypothetical protein GLOIN_2v1628132 [Rhizophagus irregularis DAOM 181602=DAOM 197198]